MGSLSYVCWAFWLAQVALVRARPDFGTGLSFAESPEISELAGLAATRIASVDDQLSAELSGLIEGSVELQALLADFGGNVATKGYTLAQGLVSSVPTTTDAPGVFGSVLSSHAEFVDYINANNQAFLSSVAVGFSQLLAEELYDSMSWAFFSMQATRDAYAALLEGLLDEDESVLPQLLRQLILTLNTLNAHLPVIVYVFQRAGLNLQIADAFYVRFSDDVSALGAGFLANDLGPFIADLLELSPSVAGNLERLLAVYSSEASDLNSGLTGPVSSVSSFGDLNNALDVFTDTAPGLLVSLQDSVAGALATYTEGIAEAIAVDYYDGEDVYLPADALVHGLIASDVFAEYCYAKYYALVADLPLLGHIRLNECLDTERARFRQLRSVIRSFVSLLSFDVEDLYENLEPCLQYRYRRNDCVADFAGFYTALGTVHLSKHNTLSTLIQVELTASNTRLQICLAAADYYTFSNLVPSLVDSIGACYAGHDCMESSCESSGEEH